jgi:hypothetical protein
MQSDGKSSHMAIDNTSYIHVIKINKQCMNDIKLSNVKKEEKKSLPTYPPADSVGRQCQTNNILRVALAIICDYQYRDLLYRGRYDIKESNLI